jgi:hypothetical protein
MGKECQGGCHRHDGCKGRVAHVWSGRTAKCPDWDWWYCDAAIERDRRNGFTVETDDEHAARLEQEETP